MFTDGNGFGLKPFYIVAALDNGKGGDELVGFIGIPRVVRLVGNGVLVGNQHFCSAWAESERESRQSFFKMYCKGAKKNACKLST